MYTFSYIQVSHTGIVRARHALQSMGDLGEGMTPGEGRSASGASSPFSPPAPAVKWAPQGEVDPTLTKLCPTSRRVPPTGHCT